MEDVQFNLARNVYKMRVDDFAPEKIVTFEILTDRGTNVNYLFIVGD